MVNAKVHLHVLSVDEGLLTGKAPEAIKFHKNKGCADIVLPTGKSKSHVMAYAEKQDNPRRTAPSALKKSLMEHLQEVVAFARIEDPSLRQLKGVLARKKETKKTTRTCARARVHTPPRT